MLDRLTRWARGALGMGAPRLEYVPLDSPRGLYPREGGVPPVVDLRGLDWGVVEDRALLRHGWFAGLGRRFAESGDEESAALACLELGRWLAADTPGKGAGWAHASDASLRVASWAIGVGALGDALDPDLRRRLAGAVRAHALFAASELGHQPDDHRRVAHAAALVFAGFGWPGLPESARLRAEGLSWLGRSLPRQVLPDGSPRGGDPGILRVVVELGRLCVDLSTRGQAPIPADIPPALQSAGFFLAAMGDAARPAQPEGFGLPDVSVDITEKDWSLLTFRAGGWAIARARGGQDRLVVPPAQSPGTLSWDIAGAPVLEAASGLRWDAVAGPGVMTLGRRDGREVRVVRAWSGPRAEARRELLLTGTRLVVTDRLHGPGEAELVWRPGPGWSLQADGEGFLAERGERVLKVSFEGAPAALVDGVLTLRVRPSDETRVRSRFELRARG